jgi:hypothetical protein
MGILKKIKNMIIRTLITVITLATTAFIVASTFEVVANTDVPFVNSLTPIGTQTAVDRILQNSDEAGPKEFSSKQYVSLGTPDHLNFPSQNIRVFAGRARDIPAGSKKFYMKPNNAHFLILNYDKNGNDGDFLFYTHQNWRTIPEANVISVGDELRVVNTRGDGFRYSITDRQILNKTDSYITTRSLERQLIIVVDITDLDQYVAFTARPNTK